MFSLPLLSFLLSIIWPTLVTGDQFSEELLLSPLQSGELHAHFKFTTVHPADLRSSQDWKHYQLLARPLGEVLATYRVQELSLSLTQGLWRAATSGYPVESAPPGAAVSARFLPEVSAEDVDIVWEGLTNALAGLLCGLQRGGDVARAQAVVDHCPDGHAVDQAVLEAGGARRDLDVEKALDQVVRAGRPPSCACCRLL